MKMAWITKKAYVDGARMREHHEEGSNDEEASPQVDGGTLAQLENGKGDS